MDRRNPAHWTHGHESDVALGQGKRSIRPKKPQESEVGSDLGLLVFLGGD